MLDSVTAAGSTPAGTAARRPAVYAPIEAEYTAALRAELDDDAVQVTRKWPDEDLLWPHSDLDLRLVLDEAPADWIALNVGIAQAHRRVVEVDPVRRRVLEHPPGWVFLRDEVDRGLVPAAELATWSSADGDPASVGVWQAMSAARPWGAEDERFYRAVLDGRTGGRYRLAADSADNVVTDRDRYGVHCVVWHFLAPVLFAHTALTTHRRPPGKTAVLRHHPDPEVHRLVEVAIAKPGTNTAERCLGTATRLVAALAPVETPNDHDRACTWAELASALGVLRCRTARYVYYLAPAAGASTGYLIDREGKDLYAATAVLAVAAPHLANEPRKMIRRFLDLVPARPTNRAGLAEFVHRLRADPGLVNALFSLPVDDLELPP